MFRFTIEYDEQGQQEHNPYIKAIAVGINTDSILHHFPLYAPAQTYGMICHNPDLLKWWERKLFENNILMRLY